MCRLLPLVCSWPPQPGIGVPLSLGSASPSAWGRHWPFGPARLCPQPTAASVHTVAQVSLSVGSAALLLACRASGCTRSRSRKPFGGCGPPGASPGAASRARRDVPLLLPLPTFVGMLTPRPPRVSPWLGTLFSSVSVGLVPLPPPGLR